MNIIQIQILIMYIEINYYIKKNLFTHHKNLHPEGKYIFGLSKIWKEFYLQN